jgi:hypothetical protein
MLQRRISAKYWQCCREDYFRNVGKVAEGNFPNSGKFHWRIFAKYWQSCRGEYFPNGNLMMRISNKYCIDNVAQENIFRTLLASSDENICQILAMLQRRIFFKY